MNSLEKLRGEVDGLWQLVAEISKSKFPYLLWEQVEQLAFSAAETAEEAKKTAPRPPLSL